MRHSWLIYAGLHDRGFIVDRFRDDEWLLELAIHAPGGLFVRVCDRAGASCERESRDDCECGFQFRYSTSSIANFRFHSKARR